MTLNPKHPPGPPMTLGNMPRFIIKSISEIRSDQIRITGLRVLGAAPLFKGTRPKERKREETF